MSRLDSAAGHDSVRGETASPTSARQAALRALLGRCARRDHAAFERLYQLTAPKLYSLCLDVLRRPELAEEVLQEVFAQIWRAAERFEGYRAAPMTWMTVLTRNRAIDVLRRRANAVASYAEQRDPLEAVDPVSDPVAYAQRLDEREALRRCLERLQARQREVIVMAFYQGLSHHQLSEAVGHPVGTVKSWIRRGLGQLKHCLEQ